MLTEAQRKKIVRARVHLSLPKELHGKRLQRIPKKICPELYATTIFERWCFGIIAGWPEAGVAEEFFKEGSGPALSLLQTRGLIINDAGRFVLTKRGDNVVEKWGGRRGWRRATKPVKLKG